MRTAAQRICSLARDISPQRSCEAPLRVERRRSLRALSKASKPNTTAKTEFSATSFAILRQKAKRGCGRTSASKFKARWIKFKILPAQHTCDKGWEFDLARKTCAVEIYKFLAIKFKPLRRAKTGAEIIKFQGKSVEEPEVWCCALKHQYSGDRVLGVCLIKFYKIWRNGHNGPFLDAKRA